MGYEARVLLDSVSPAGHRLTTFEVTLPRIVLAEFNTHCVFARNSASSRAIPVSKMLERVMTDPFIPTYWGKNQKGMQAAEQLSPAAQVLARDEWLRARDNAVESVKRTQMDDINLHKQLANRMLEPWLWHTIITTATEWSNFFNLRAHPHAQPEIQIPAKMMKDLYEKNTPDLLVQGSWHLPLVYKGEGQMVFPEDFESAEAIAKDKRTHWLEVLKKVSAGRCARVSYLTHEGKRDLPADVDMCNGLVKNGHMSPLEHPARPMNEAELDTYYMQHLVFEDGTTANSRSDIPWRPGVEVMSGGELRKVKSQRTTYFCAKFNGWIQMRKEIPFEHDALGNR